MKVRHGIVIGVVLALGHFNTAVARDFIVLMDGTANSPQGEVKMAETNVWRLAKLLGVQAPERRDDGCVPGVANGNKNQPWVLYVYGVGTDPASVKEQTRAQAFGGEVMEIVDRARTKLEGSGITADDKVLLFGFSRGAASVRFLANEIYQRKINNHPATIRFMGIWDTVAAIGIPKPEADFKDASIRKDFPEISAAITIPPIVQHVVHLVALDEKRSAFWPTLARAADPASTTVEEVWFAGSHSDIGGGWAEESEDRERPLRLWQVTLEYMLRASHGVELLKFDDAKGRVERFQPNPLAAGIGHGPERLDFSQLARTRVRNFEEVLESSGLPVNSTVKVHRSVEGRMENTKNTKTPYQPKCLSEPARFEFYPKRSQDR